MTDAQTARFGEWTQKWIEIGLSTKPADFAKVTGGALKAYDLCKLKWPMVLLRMGSPYSATVGGALAWMYLCVSDEEARADVDGEGTKQAS